jgi:hypothetical protein
MIATSGSEGSNRYRKPLSLKTRNNVLAVLSKVLRNAEEVDLIDRVPKIRSYRCEKPEIGRGTSRSGAGCSRGLAGWGRGCWWRPFWPVMRAYGSVRSSPCSGRMWT